MKTTPFEKFYAVILFLSVLLTVAMLYVSWHFICKWW